ncbi:MAG: T9SS type A sorting domain-containing protein [Saprospiraceae bacterium]|nr:T9SS type A sorting domain-containing protein [Saprospiraceae bacterium]
MKRTTQLIYLFALVAGSSLLMSKQNGQNKRYAGAPGDVVSTGCSDPGQGCHDLAPTTGASITLTGVPSSYIAGRVYPLTLTVSDPTMSRAGFQIVAKDAAAANAYTNIGTFSSVTGTKVITGTTASSNGPGRLVHSTDKAMTGGSASWTFNWTAPSTGLPANIVFYYSGVAADGDGNEGTFGNSGDKSVWGNTGNIPIGVELMSFEASLLKSSHVKLAWKTASEKNSAAFVIERKAENGLFFEETGKIEAHGSTNEAHDYSFVDETAEIGRIIYYRLKQIDFDGTTNYSKTISVAVKTPFKIKVYPTVVKNGDLVTVETVGASASGIDIQVLNMSGQVVKLDKTASYTEGGQFHVSNLPTGRYLIVAADAKKKNYGSFVVQ